MKERIGVKVTRRELRELVKLNREMAKGSASGGPRIPSTADYENAVHYSKRADQLEEVLHEDDEEAT